MPDIRAGFVAASYLLEAAHSIDLTELKQLFGDRISSARLDDKAPGPSRLQYVQAPQIIDGDAFRQAELDGFRVRIKFYTYGVIAVLLSRPFSGSWADLVALGQSLIENEGLEDHAAALGRTVVERIRSACRDVRAQFLTEDYLVFAATELESPASAEELVERHGA